MKRIFTGTRALAAAIALFAVSASVSTPAMSAGTLTGKIGVTLVIGDACKVGNSSVDDSTNSWGTLNFGTYSDLTSVIDGAVVGSDSSNAITITCSAGLSPTLTIDGGLNESGTLRYMTAASTSSTTSSTTTTDTNIAYRLYSDSARTTEVAIDGSISISANGSAVSLPLYGRVLPSDQSSTAPASGTYADTLVATLAW